MTRLLLFVLRLEGGVLCQKLFEIVFDLLSLLLPRSLLLLQDLGKLLLVLSL